MRLYAAGSLQHWAPTRMLPLWLVLLRCPPRPLPLSPQHKGFKGGWGKRHKGWGKRYKGGWGKRYKGGPGLPGGGCWAAAKPWQAHSAKARCGALTAQTYLATGTAISLQAASGSDCRWPRRWAAPWRPQGGLVVVVRLMGRWAGADQGRACWGEGILAGCDCGGLLSSRLLLLAGAGA